LQRIIDPEAAARTQTQLVKNFANAGAITPEAAKLFEKAGTFTNRGETQEEQQLIADLKESQRLQTEAIAAQANLMNEFANRFEATIGGEFAAKMEGITEALGGIPSDIRMTVNHGELIVRIPGAEVFNEMLPSMRALAIRTVNEALQGNINAADGSTRSSLARQLP